jgi:acyl-CoA reductase-like NAD-dependent aldehyde dehydrogenase
MTTETRIVNPYDQRVLASLPVFTGAAVRAAVDRAAASAAGISRWPAAERDAMLHQAAHYLIEERDSLARLIARESGKPIRLARAEAQRAAGVLMQAVGAAPPGSTLPLSGGPIVLTLRAPIGIVAALTAFYTPLDTLVALIAGALATGCPLVLKPAVQTPLAALRLADLFEQAGLPAGLLEIVLGDVETGQALAADARIRLIACDGPSDPAWPFTPETGPAYLCLEPCPVSVVVIAADADIHRALPQIVADSLAYSGQFPTCARRIYIQRSLYDSFRQQILDRVAALRSGSPLDDQTDLGPLLTDESAQRVVDQIAGAIDEGAWLLAGGTREGRWVAPTVLENVDESLSVIREPAPGPVISLLPFERLDDLLPVLDHPQTAVGFFTRDLARAVRVAQGIGAGRLVVNGAPGRSDGLHTLHRALQAMTRPRAIYLQTGS